MAADLRGPQVIGPGAQPVGDQINDLAVNQFDWQALSLANRDYLAQVIDRGDNA